MHIRSWVMTAAMASFVVAAPAMSFGTAVPLITNAPRLKLAPPAHALGDYGWSSSNWSGYAVTAGPYTQITGDWTVPKVSSGHGSTYSSAWIGIDGFNNSDLIQTGTEQNYSGGQAQYSAWWEILPAAETVIDEPVAPGNQMAASIVNDGGGVWTITLQDVTAGWKFTTNQDYSGPGASAEWILEAPTIGGHVATLANYGQTTFNPGTVNDGANPAFTVEDGGVMIQKNKQVSTPSVPDSDTDGFNAAYGSTAPNPPAS